MLVRHHPLTLAIATLISCGTLLGTSMAATSARADDSAPQYQLDSIHISALPFDDNAHLTGASFGFLEDVLLFQRSKGTLGDTLSGLPGVHSDSFAGGASRPVIRGQSGPRVAVLSDGAALFDASAISPDHAVTMEPMLTRKLEVLRGPATLLYGGGAIGGVVNVLDNKIPSQMPLDGVEGFLALRGNSVADEKALAGSFTGQLTEHLAFNVEASHRDADDYEVAGFTVQDIDGSAAESHTGSVGLSWIGNNGYIGLAYSYRRDDYGLPGHDEEFASCVADGSQLDCSGDADHDHDHDHGAPHVDLASRRIDARGEYQPQLDSIERIRFRSSYTDYRHHEIEDDRISTTFLNKGYENRVELQHAPIAGWHGVVGAQYADTQFNSRGAESFVPKTDSRLLGLFAVEHYQFNDQWHLELGARHERQKLDPIDDERNRPTDRQSANSYSSSLTWAFQPDYNVSLSATRAQRLPHAQELYARGVHLATNTFECGLLDDEFTCGGEENNARLAKETSHNLGLNLRKTHGDLTFDVGLFQNRVDNYIYARTLDQIEQFRLIKYSQDDAEFIGAEAELRYQWQPRLATTLFGDIVKAELRDSGDELPRTPARRLGLRANSYWGDFDGELEFYRVFAQNDIAGFETRTPGHDMVNATLSYTIPSNQPLNIFLRGNNLLAEKVFNHTSFLANRVPEPGRNLTLGMRLEF